MTIDEWWMSLAQRRRLRRVSLSFFKQTIYLSSTFNIRYSKFALRFFNVSLLIKLKFLGQSSPNSALTH
jgi:hypothetical protein